MGLKLYHQVGHCDKWNVDSFQVDHCGDGLILSPVHQPRARVENLPAKIRKRSLFDPQYYLPNSTKPKLASYEFFPEQISGGFSTQDFPLVALQSAAQCVAFQIKQNFEGIIIPARFIDQMASKYFEIQEEYTVHPFLKEIVKTGTSKPVYLTLPLTSAMLLDAGFRTDILNWVTGFPEIAGVYILVADERPTKQIRSVPFLSSYIEFAADLSETGLKLILGHLNTEIILFTMIDGATLTFGSFENTRIFSIDKFLETDEERRGPKARIYLPALLNWVQFDQAVQIRSDDPAIWDEIYRPTPHSEKVLASPSVEPHFNQPELYRHHFLNLYEQIQALGGMPLMQRYVAIKDALRTAMELNERIEAMPLQLDRHGNGEHIPVWLDCLNQFYRRYLKP